MADKDFEDRDLRKFERELEHREKNLDAANDLLKDAPSLLAELTNEVVIPLLQGLQPQQQRQVQQQLWQPPKQDTRSRSKPEYDPTDPQNQDIPGPQSVNNEDENND